MIKALFAGTALCGALASSASAVTAFNFDGLTAGYYAGSLTVVDAGVTLKVTNEGYPAGSVLITNSGIPLLGSRSAIGSQTNPINSNQFAPLRFSFSTAINSITFAFGDGGGDSDSPVVIAAYDAASTFLGSVTDSYPSGYGAGKSLTLNFANARYFVASSGVLGQNKDSIFWEVTSLTAGGVPEPMTWALMLTGFGAVGAAMRRRQGAMRFA